MYSLPRYRQSESKQAERWIYSGRKGWIQHSPWIEFACRLLPLQASGCQGRLYILDLPVQRQKEEYWLVIDTENDILFGSLLTVLFVVRLLGDLTIAYCRKHHLAASVIAWCVAKSLEVITVLLFYCYTSNVSPREDLPFLENERFTRNFEQ